VAKFSARAMKAAREAPEVEPVDDVVLEISEAVAMHWQDSVPYFVAAGTAAKLARPGSAAAVAEFIF
jgi:hypothetical protein